MARFAKHIVVLALGWVSKWYGNVGLILSILRRILSLVIGLVLVSKELGTAPRILDRPRQATGMVEIPVAYSVRAAAC